MWRRLRPSTLHSIHWHTFPSLPGLGGTQWTNQTQIIKRQRGSGLHNREHWMGTSLFLNRNLQTQSSSFSALCAICTINHHPMPFLQCLINSQLWEPKQGDSAAHCTVVPVVKTLSECWCSGCRQQHGSRLQYVHLQSTCLRIETGASSTKDCLWADVHD